MRAGPLGQQRIKPNVHAPEIPLRAFYKIIVTAALDFASYDNKMNGASTALTCQAE